MGYTEYVDKGTASPSRQAAYRSFISLFLPPLFCEMIEKPSAPFPPWSRGLLTILWRKKTGHKPLKVCSCSVHIRRGKVGYTKDVDEGGHNTESIKQPTNLYFSFTPFYFVHEENTLTLLPRQRQGVFLRMGIFVKNLLNTVQKLFTYRAEKRVILRMSSRERNDSSG